ncbi:MAG: cyclic nucleotide-binding domain-containing protein [Alphaproteobacteria bacterium]|nr:cyclic nucleotide-binding domain-containing protein [Alphaproteobacteria bacterium]
MEIMQVPKGQNIFTQGEVATSAYILASGSVAIYREIEGKRLPVARIRKGEMFGEMAIIDGTARRATAVVLEDSTLSLIAKDMIEKKMAASDPMVQKVMHTLIDSLRSVPENHTPKPRNVQDIANDIKEQAAKAAQLIGESTSRDMKAAAQVPVEKLGHLVQDICGLLDRGAIKDTRAPVKPTTQEIDAAVKSAGG